MLALFGVGIFLPSGAQTHNLLEALSVFVFDLAQLVLSVWALFLFVKCLAEVHDFSAWKDLAAAILGSLLIGSPALACYLTLMILR